MTLVGFSLNLVRLLRCKKYVFGEVAPQGRKRPYATFHIIILNIKLYLDINY
jgi:hypothetical protein